MRQVFKTLIEMIAAKVIGRYALGGAMAALFYAEPVLTYDMDVFVFLPDNPEPLIDLSPLYTFLKRRGCREERECVLIAGLPVQFIPAYNALIEEAVRHARRLRYKGVPALVLAPEYLVAVALQTGRDKDRARVTAFLKQVKMDTNRLRDILGRHGLDARFKVWRKDQP